MIRPRHSTFAPLLAALVILTVPLGAAYVGGYFWLGEYDCYQSPGWPPVINRTYRYQWQATIFWPAARLEQQLRGIDVSLQRAGAIGGVI